MIVCTSLIDACLEINELGEDQFGQLRVNLISITLISETELINDLGEAYIEKNITQTDKPNHPWINGPNTQDGHAEAILVKENLLKFKLVWTHMYR
jgi:hypothetical protein